MKAWRPGGVARRPPPAAAHSLGSARRREESEDGGSQATGEAVPARFCPWGTSQGLTSRVPPHSLRLPPLEYPCLTVLFGFDDPCLVHAVSSHEFIAQLSKCGSQVPESWLLSASKCPLEFQSSRVWAHLSRLNILKPGCSGRRRRASTAASRRTATTPRCARGSARPR